MLTLLPAGVASRATTFYVSSTTDSTNVTSLRGAIIAANALGGANLIFLTNSVYRLTRTGYDEDGCLTGDLDVTSGNLTIVGLNAANATLDATALGDRIIQVLPQAQLTLINVVLFGGKIPLSFTYGESGGAIYNSGALTMNNCVVTNNTIGDGWYLGGDGGGIYNLGVLDMMDCFISSNKAGDGSPGYRSFYIGNGGEGGNGGGLCNFGSAILYNCTIRGNSAGSGNTTRYDVYASGGGIYNSGNLTLSDCIVSENKAGNGNYGLVFLSLSVAYPNIPGAGGDGGSGGGVYSSGSTILTRSSIINNISGNGGDGSDGYAASQAPGGSGGQGAGLFSSGTLSLTNCTVFGNKCGTGGKGGNGVNVFASSVNQDASSISGGKAGDGGTGGGVWNSGILNVVASTICGNFGGIAGSGGNGESRTYNYYIYDNSGHAISTAQAYNNGIGGLGGNGGNGGIVTLSTNPLAAVQNSLVALNSEGASGIGGQGQTTNGGFIQSASGSNSFGIDVGGSFNSLGHNLIGIARGSLGYTNGTNADLVGSEHAPLNPLLGTLAYNGGFTPTVMPLSSSPAIDAGDDILYYNLPSDQRGQPRRFGAHVDIGAVEYNGLANGIVLPPILNGLQKTSNGFQLSFIGATQIPYTVLASTNLTNWLPVGNPSETSQGQFVFQDTNALNFPKRYYRLHQP